MPCHRNTGASGMLPQRITQAALQLASNAVRHTSDGGTIALGTRLDEKKLVHWERDTGLPGLLR